MSRGDQTLLVPCPTCSRRIAYTPANRWRPFCSERCRSIDLGAWASERFRVTSPAQPGDGEDTALGSIEPRPPGA
ncbi:MAG TPA: DNA gyrase inhibitor YacG [Burkholderiaceae bacterium]|nr:DNA gyrase inhibitor YacG [Burkholderiaceae bacterium]